jgi:hypothetical protein
MKAVKATEAIQTNGKRKLLSHSRWVAGCILLVTGSTALAQDNPNILVIWGDDIGQSNISAYTFGLVGYALRTSTG